MDLRRAAVGLQKAAEQKFGIKPKVKTGSAGSFTLLVNGRNVFDHKQEGGGLPGREELLRRIARALEREAAPARSG